MVAILFPKMIKSSEISHSSPWITTSDIAFVSAALADGMLAQGAGVKEFEARCAAYLGFSCTHAVASGQVALLRALTAIGLKNGSEVIMPSYVCRAVADAVIEAGATPVFCDVGDDWCVSRETIAPVITHLTAAIVVVHPFGIVADVGPILEFGLPVVEDCCQCFTPRVGHLGTVAIFSFHATKCLTTGEGGLVASSDSAFVERYMDCLASYPEASRMSDLQAALGLGQMERYDEMLQWRKDMASQYRDSIPKENCERLSAVWDRSMFYRIPLSTNEGYDIVAPEFIKRGVNVRRGVDRLLHRQAGLPDRHFKTTVELFRTTLSVPFYPALGEGDVRRVTAAIEEVFS
jgi:perosamine synthetase